jgi:hypothetical protein
MTLEQLKETAQGLMLADLSEANLTRADLSGADLDGANLSGIKDDYTVWPKGFDAPKRAK